MVLELGGWFLYSEEPVIMLQEIQETWLRI